MISTDLEFNLKMCGKRIYVSYFELWDRTGFDELQVRTKMKQAGKEDDGIKMCIQAARRIAESGLQFEALKIIASSPRVDKTAREKAQSLLRIMN